uniref:Uncharacterized protein n=1 Tax=Oryza sativa subsp. japonica TaxID=39947 RepID=Q7XIT9_ORYSJ|nr:hypothetical protein [Oryza sativa Japonica Group]BAD31209.1 hypothetical protein [Oryza sativa Japonica Group]
MSNQTQLSLGYQVMGENGTEISENSGYRFRFAPTVSIGIGNCRYRKWKRRPPSLPHAPPPASVPPSQAPSAAAPPQPPPPHRCRPFLLSPSPTAALRQAAISGASLLSGAREGAKGREENERENKEEIERAGKGTERREG